MTVDEAIGNNKNLGFVAEPLEKSVSQAKDAIPAAPLVISRNTEQFKVIDFNPNRVQLATNFNTGKFLVYTDSYDKNWKVFVNQHEQKLYRANMAFKGVWLPAGRNEVKFQYSIRGEKELYLLILMVGFLLAIYFVRTLCIR